MIAGIGIDIIEVSRVAEKISKESGFREKVFSYSEIVFCEQKKERNQHYAARFAAKEAFLKATGKGMTLGYTLADIEIVNDGLGKPEIRLSGTFGTYAKQQGWNKIHVSVSHLNNMACAVVVLEA